MSGQIAADLCIPTAFQRSSNGGKNASNGLPTENSNNTDAYNPRCCWNTVGWHRRPARWAHFSGSITPGKSVGIACPHLVPVEGRRRPHFFWK